MQPAACDDALQVEKVQSELDGLAATLKQVELYNEQMKGEIAVTRRYSTHSHWHSSVKSRAASCNWNLRQQATGVISILTP